MPRRISASASELDRSLYILFRTAGHSPGVERAVRSFSKLGEHGLLWQAIALGGAVVDPARRPRWLRMWATVAASFGLNQLIKLTFRRPRPDVEGLPPLIGTISNRSYPSAHATTAAAAAQMVPALYPLAIAMAVSRLYLGVHWPSDVAAGFALGTAVGELAS